MDAIRRIGPLAALCALLACTKPRVPPTARIAGEAAVSVAVGVPVALDGSASAAAGNGALELRWTLARRPGTSAAELATPSGPKSWLLPDAEGDYEVELAVYDGVLWSAPTSVRISAGCLHAPLVAVEAAPAAPAVGEPVLLAAVVSDADAACPGPRARVVEFRWTLAESPAGSRAAIVHETDTSPQLVPDLAGSYRAVLEATDETGLVGRGEVVVEAGACGGAAPAVGEVTADPAAPSLGQAVTLRAQVSDADNAPPCSLGQSLALRWRFASLPRGSRAALDRPEADAPQFVPDAPGRYELEVTAGDGTGRTGTGRLAVDVPDCGKSAPRVTLLVADPTATTTGGTVRLAATVEDGDAAAPCNLAEAHTLEWRIAAQPAGSAARLSDALAFEPWFRADRPGLYRVEVVAHDAGGLVGPPAAVEVTAAACGDAAPEVQIAATEDGVGAPVQLDATATDADTAQPCGAPPELAWRWWVGGMPPGATAELRAADGPRPWFVPDRAGTYVVRATATDASGRTSAPAAAQVEVSACGGRPPTVSASASPAPATVGATVVATATASDDDAAPPCSRAASFTYGWWFDEVPPGSRAALNDPAVRAPSFVADAAGTYRLRVVATDEAGRPSEPAEVEVTVDPCGGAAPTVAPTAAPASAGLGVPVVLDAGAEDADALAPCNATPRFRHRWWIEERPSGSAAELNDPLVARPTLRPDLPGTYVARVVVADETGRTNAPGRAEVTALPCGAAAPEVAPTASPPSPNTGAVVQLDAGATDGDEAAPCSRPATLSYRWWFQEKPASSGATLDSASRANPSFRPDAAGGYVLGVVATDETGRTSAPGFVPVAAAPCGSASPSVTTSHTPPAPNSGDVVQAIATASDADAACGVAVRLAYRWWFEDLPAGSRARLNDPAVKAPSFIADLPGTYRLAVEVADETGRTSGPVALPVSVSPCGSQAPTATGAGATPASAAVGVPVQLAVTAGDDDISTCGLAQRLATRWRTVSLPLGSAAALSDPDLARPSFVPDVAGTYSFEAVVTDSTGRASAAASVTVTADPCGQAAPTAALGVAPSTANIDEPVAFTAALDDADNAPACALLGVPTQALRPIWRLVEAPPQLLAAGPPPGELLQGTTVAFRPPARGTYVVEVVAEDSTGRRSAPGRATLTVRPCGDNRPVAFIQMTSPELDPDSCDAAAPFIDVGSVGGCTAAAPPPVQLDAACSTDADNDPSCAPLQQDLEYEWTLLRTPAGSAAVLQPSDDGRTVWFQPDAAISGDYEVGLRVFDGRLWSEQARVKLRRAPLTAPAAIQAATVGTPSLRTNSDGSSLIAFRHSSAPNVRIGRCDSPPCTASSWSFAGVSCAGQTTVSLNRYRDDPLAYDLSYTAGGAGGDLFVARCSGASCFTAPGSGCGIGVPAGVVSLNVTGSRDTVVSPAATSFAQARDSGFAGSDNFWVAYHNGSAAGIVFCAGGGSACDTAANWCPNPTAAVGPAGRIDASAGNPGRFVDLHAAPDGAGADVLVAAYMRTGAADDVVLRTCRNTDFTCDATLPQCLQAANWSEVVVDGDGNDDGRFISVWRTSCADARDPGRIHVGYWRDGGLLAAGDTPTATSSSYWYASCYDPAATCPQIRPAAGCGAGSTSCLCAGNWQRAIVSFPRPTPGGPGLSLHVNRRDGLPRVAYHHHSGPCGEWGLRMAKGRRINDPVLCPAPAPPCRLSFALASDPEDCPAGGPQCLDWTHTSFVCGNSGHDPSLFIHTDGTVRSAHVSGGVCSTSGEMYFQEP